METPKKRVIIDVDVGTDDYLACILLFEAAKRNFIEIVAIICTAGNTNRENVVENVLKLLHLYCQQTKIPIYKGANGPLVPHPLNRAHSHFHGIDGFADLNLQFEYNSTNLQTQKPGAVALYEFLSENPGTISIICLGPLSTVACALHLGPVIPKDIWIMGGNYGENITIPEFNFNCDLEAVYCVFHLLKCPFFILPWEPCLLSNISKEWRFGEFASAVQHPSLDYLNRAEEVLYRDESAWCPCDAFLAAIYLSPDEICTRKTIFNTVTIDLFPHDLNRRGELILTHNNETSQTRTITIFENIHADNFKQHLLQLFQQ